MSTFKGALRSKRKNELIDMASALGLRVDEDTAKRDDVETLVRQHLLNNRSALHSSATWSGIYNSIDKGAARSSSAGFGLDSDASDEGGKKHTQKGRAGANGGVITPARRTSTVATEGAHNIATAISAKARRSIEDLSSAFRSGASNVRNEISEEVQDATNEVTHIGHKLRLAGRRVVRRTERQYADVLNRTRSYLSNAQHVTAVLLIFEAVFLVSQLMPLTNIQFGQSAVKTFVKNATGKGGQIHIPRSSVALPQLWALLTVQFWRPILLWFAWSVGIPLVAANLVTFEKRHEASMVTFNVVRLALLSALSKTSIFAAGHHVPSVFGVAAGEVQQAGAFWLGSLTDKARSIINYQFVAAYINTDLQILTASLGLAFAAYEVASHRPRAS